MITALIFLTLLAAEDVSSPVFFAGNEELRGYLMEAAERNPGLKARHLEWQAALERVPQVTSLEDPMLMYGQFVRSQDKRFEVALEQKFPWFGTLRARGDKALAEAEAALARFYAARNELFAKVKQAYFDYTLLGESIGVVQSQVEVLGDVEEIVRTRYALGLSPEADLFRVQVEKETVGDQLKGLNQSRPVLAAKLNAALGRETGAEVPWPQPSPFPSPAPDGDEMLARIHAANPDLAAMQRMIEGWEKGVAVAKKMAYPEFALGLQYGGMKNTDTDQARAKTRYIEQLDAIRMLAEDAPTRGFTSVMNDIRYGNFKDQFLLQSESVEDDVMIYFKLSLPVWRKRIHAGIEEAKLMAEAAEQDKHRATLALESAAHSARFGIEDGLRRYALYKDTLIPKQKQTYESLQGAYSAGESNETGLGFLDILQAVRTLLEFRLEQARAARDVQMNCAELEMLMGGPWVESPPAP